MEENSSNLDPYQFLTVPRLQQAINADLGPGWKLKDFEVKDFTKKGDNYASIVTGVSCRATNEGTEKTRPYVAKLNGVIKDEMGVIMFEREGKFLTNLALSLNAILKPIYPSQINFPVCVYAGYEGGSEILILKDLRWEGYKKIDKKRGMDFEHSKIVIKELAKLHATSLIFANTLKNETLLEKYPFLGNEWINQGTQVFELFKSIMDSGVSTSLALISQLNEYNEQSNWLERHRGKLMDIYLELLNSSPKNMRVINHGDCWNNNLVFCYDDIGHPLEVTLLDLQACRVGSIGLDLNYFFYSSLTGESRNENFEKFLSEYYEEFENVMKSDNKDMPFTRDELQKEVLDKTLFGMISGIMALPFFICEGDDAPDISTLGQESNEEFFKDFSDSAIKSSVKSPALKTRFLSIFDDMKTKGILLGDHDCTPPLVEENSLNLDSHQFLTVPRLQQAINSDLGPGWKLKDFEVVDFTKKGDNYASIVKGVSCLATKKGNEIKRHYVAKLNEVIKEEYGGIMFEREGKFLIDVAPTLNEILKPIYPSQIHFPVCVYAGFEGGSEILISKDLRFEGYKMIDKKWGIDFEHSRIVIKELAKLHATSVIFANSLKNQTILEKYPFLGNEWMTRTKTFELFESIIDSGVSTSMAIIRQLNEYNEQNNWLETHRNKLLDIYFKLVNSSPDNMRVINHGDCWNNNLVFRYDDMGHPLEVTLLDLQICRVGSIGLDLNYFFYSSLTGESRNENFEKFLSEYYEEFENVMKSDNKDMPFTRDELQKEVLDKTLFGIISGMMALPFFICEGDDAPDISTLGQESNEEFFKDFSDSAIKSSAKSPALKTRFLSLFDDMKTKGILLGDHDCSPPLVQNNAYQLLTRNRLQDIVEADLGLQWKLKDFKIQDFTKKGDNYACKVTGVSCIAMNKGEEKNTFYVAKLNPQLSYSLNNEMSKENFEREGGFLMKVAPALNTILEEIHYPRLNLPDCVYGNFNGGAEILILRDLRLKGFKMHDKRKGMDFEHAKILVKELAKIHASSVIFKSRLPNNNTILDMYPFMVDSWLNPGGDYRKMSESFFECCINISLGMINNLTQYKRQYDWFQNIKSQVMDIYCKLIKKSPENMRVICHGDCWNNNILFRYDGKGNPLEVTLLDLQFCRFGSVGLDLNFFLYTTLTGEVRNEFLNKILSEYYEEFEKVITSASMEMSFTQEEFQKEVGNKTLYGILNGILVLPMVICENEDAPEFSNIEEDDTEKYLKEFNNSMSNLSSSVFNCRYRDMFDDIEIRGIMNENITSF